MIATSLAGMSRVKRLQVFNGQASNMTDEYAVLDINRVGGRKMTAPHGTYKSLVPSKTNLYSV